MSNNTRQSARLRGALLAAAVAVLATGCSPPDTPDTPATTTPEVPLLSSVEQTDALVQVGSGIDSALKASYEKEKRYPRTMKLDTAANTLDLDVHNAASTKILDANSFTGEVSLAWFRDYQDHFKGYVRMPKGKKGGYSFCISSKDEHAVPSSDTASNRTGEIRDGPCSSAPAKP